MAPINFFDIFHKIQEYYLTVYKFFTGELIDFSSFFFWIKIIAGIVSVILASGLAYNIFQLTKTKKQHLKEIIKFVIEPAPKERVSQWDIIKRFLDSDDSANWRRAILEADSLLVSILARAGYAGSNLGTMLLKVKPYMLESRPELFKAHLARNKVAREGVAGLTKEEAERIIGLYEKALIELEYI